MHALWQAKKLNKLRREIALLQGFYQQQPTYRLASDLGADAKTEVAPLDWTVFSIS